VTVRVGRDGLFGNGAALEKAVTIVTTVTSTVLFVLTGDNKIIKHP